MKTKKLLFLLEWMMRVGEFLFLEKNNLVKRDKREVEKESKGVDCRS